MDFARFSLLLIASIFGVDAPALLALHGIRQLLCSSPRALSPGAYTITAKGWEARSQKNVLKLVNAAVCLRLKKTSISERDPFVEVRNALQWFNFDSSIQFLYRSKSDLTVHYLRCWRV